jgi:hypothetical protein
MEMCSLLCCQECAKWAFLTLIKDYLAAADDSRQFFHNVTFFSFFRSEMLMELKVYVVTIFL